MDGKTLRLHFPQWQGGNIEAYHFGSQLLAMLAPAPMAPSRRSKLQNPTVPSFRWKTVSLRGTRSFGRSVRQRKF